MKKTTNARGLIITTNGTTGIINFENQTAKLEELQKLVGGYIEIINLSSNMVMVVNEEGLLLNLPANDLATSMYNNLEKISFESEEYFSKLNLVFDKISTELKLVGDVLLINNTYLK